MQPLPLRLLSAPQRRSCAGGKTFHPGTGLAGDAGENVLSWSEDYYYCLMGWTAKWTSPRCPKPGNGSSCGGAVPPAQNWSKPSVRGCKMTASCAACLQAAGTLVDTQFGNAWSKAAECEDSCFADGDVANELVRQLRAKATSGDTTPWFLAMGNRNPHLPWYAPSKYFDQVDAAAPSSVHIATHPHQPTHALASGDPYDIFEFKLMNDLRDVIYNNSGFPEVPTELHYGLRRGYWAAIAHSDAQVGKVLDAVREIGAEDNTIVAVTGDHGYGLGELGSWGKCASAFPPLASFLAALKWRSGDRHAAGARNTCPHHYLRAVTQPRG